MWNLDGCHSRINEHEVEAMPQNLVSHLLQTDGSRFLFGLILDSLKIYIYNVYIRFTMHGNQHCLHKYAPQRAAQKRCLTTAFIWRAVLFFTAHEKTGLLESDHSSFVFIHPSSF